LYQPTTLHGVTDQCREKRALELTIFISGRDSKLSNL